MTQETELLPCPFCGGEPTKHNAWVGCTNKACEVRPVAKYYKNIDNGVKDWNTRSRLGKVETKPVEVGELVDLLREHGMQSDNYHQDQAQAILSRYNVTKKE